MGVWVALCPFRVLGNISVSGCTVLSGTCVAFFRHLGLSRGCSAGTRFVLVKLAVRRFWVVLLVLVSCW